MKRNDGPVSDALVDAYRAIIAANTEPKRVAMPGAGVDPQRVVKPGKRLRNWHRSSRPGVSLRAFVKGIAASQDSPRFTDTGTKIAQRWLASKGVRL